MGSPPAERAQRVCAACRARKKMCDKQLPICGSCLKRGFICRYDASPTESDTSGSSTHVSQSPWVVYTADKPGRPSPLAAPTPPPPNQPGPSCALTPSGGRKDLDSIAYGKLVEVLTLCGLSIDQVTDRFLAGGVHNWLPVVSPRLLLAATSELRRLRAAPSPPPADLSVLLLAMCLLAMYPTEDNADHATGPADLYQTAKVLLGHVQVMAAASTRLLHAAVLVCAFEYALGRLDAAYVSIGTCERTARVLGIDRDPSEALRDGGGDDPLSKLKRLEEWNTWRGIVVLETAVSSEFNSRHYRPIMPYPALHPCPLSGLLPTADVRMAREDSCIVSEPSPVSDAPALLSPAVAADEARVLKRFERQVRATSFLRRTLQIAGLPIEAGAKISQLRELDGELLSFISAATADQDDKSHCGALATAVRSLFLLHHTILSSQSSSDGAAATMTTEDESAADSSSSSSLAALDTAARLVAHAAADHLETRSVEALPPCCAYNLRAAAEHLTRSQSQSRSHRRDPSSADHRGGGDDDGSSSSLGTSSLASCLALEKAFLVRWMGRRRRVAAPEAGDDNPGGTIGWVY